MPFTISNRPWPANRPRTQADNIRRAVFTPKTFGKAAHAATNQIHSAGGYDVIISTACPLDLGLNEYDFTPYMDDQGVVVHASFDGGVRVFTCDRWVHLTQNLWAIAQHIKAVRDQANWGVATVAEALAAFRMLPEHTEARRGSNNAAMAELTNARGQALAQLRDQ